MLTFGWGPDFAPGGEHKAKMVTCAFGDRYTQRAPDGLNNDMPTWNLSFSLRADAEFVAISAFLDQVHASGETFLWTPPRRLQGMYYCTGWKEVPYVNGVSAHTITATFERTMA